MATEVTVGVRELKARLSYYIDIAKAGETVIVTERGTPVAQLQPIAREPETVRERLLAAAKAGILDWNGERLEPIEAPIKNTSGRLVSDLLLEDRD